MANGFQRVQYRTGHRSTVKKVLEWSMSWTDRQEIKVSTEAQWIRQTESSVERRTNWSKAYGWKISQTRMTSNGLTKKHEMGGQLKSITFSIGILKTWHGMSFENHIKWISKTMIHYSRFEKERVICLQSADIINTPRLGMRWTE